MERGDMAFLKDLLSPGPGANDDFSREWQDAFGVFEPSNTPPAADEALNSGAAANPPSSSPTGFLPSQLLDHSLSSTGRQARPLPVVVMNCSTNARMESNYFLVCCCSSFQAGPLHQCSRLCPCSLLLVRTSRPSWPQDQQPTVS